MDKNSQERFLGALVRSLTKWMKIYPNPKSTDYHDSSSNGGKYLFVERIHNHNTGTLITTVVTNTPILAGSVMVKLDCNFEPYTQRRLLQLRVGNRNSNQPGFVSTEGFPKGTNTKTIKTWLEDQFAKAAETN